MAVIYTISHPITNEVVYIGCTENLDIRSKAHVRAKNGTRISEYIGWLRSNFMLPKIEELEIVTDEPPFELELYWIRQMKAWGFDLLNENKVKPLNNFYKEEKLSYLNPGIRTSKKFKWRHDMFFVDNSFEIGNRNSFYTTFRHYRKLYNKVGLRLDFEIVEGKLIATITDRPWEPKVKIKPAPKIRGRKKKEVCLGDLEPLLEVKAHIDLLYLKPFASLKVLLSNKFKHVPVKRFSYQMLGANMFRITRVK